MSVAGASGSARRATAAGLAAIMLWASLALLTAATAGIPPFELLALSFTVAGVIGCAFVVLRGERPVAPAGAWCLGFAGLFFYHALYFVALKLAPPARASLVAYLWPLLIVLLGARRPHAGLVIGAALGLGGTALLLRGDAASSAAPWLGYLAALGCALVWSGYSVANRRYADAPSAMVAPICLAVALAGLVCHLAFETTVRPGWQQGLAILALGVGPVGLAFFAWDHATKHGDLPLLGALSYLAPLLSTLLLVATGQETAGARIAGAATLIVAGAALAGRGASRTA